MPVTREEITALADSEITQVKVWAEDELKSRSEKLRQETIARIKEMAGAVGVRVAIGGMRGRPPKGKAPPHPEKLARRNTAGASGVAQPANDNAPIPVRKTG